MSGSAWVSQSIKVLRDMGGRLAQPLYPSICPGCGDAVDRQALWCSSCSQQMAILINQEYCHRCGAGLGPHVSLSPSGRCRNCVDQQPWPINGLVRVGPYEGLLQDLVVRFKFRREEYLAGLLARRLAGRLGDQGRWLEDIEALVPIPAHWLTKLIRGSDHAGTLAEDLGHLSGKPVLSVLTAGRMVRRQVGLNARQRRENVKGLFRVRTTLDLAGCTLCLVDDVATTGATLCEAARALKAAGVARVYAAVVAKSRPISF